MSHSSSKKPVLTLSPPLYNKLKLGSVAPESDEALQLLDTRFQHHLAQGYSVIDTVNYLTKAGFDSTQIQMIADKYSKAA